jgi:EamA domain-containing membrane protein RarD
MAWKFNDDPSAVFQALFEVIRQGLPMLVLLGAVTLTPQQLVGIMLFVSPLLTFLSILFVRKQAIAKTTADAQITTALNADPATTTVKDVITQTQAAKEAA